MNKKQFMGVALLMAGTLAVGAGAGTSYAKFTTQVSGQVENDAVQAARFDISSSVKDATKNVQVPATHFYPGTGMQVLRFDISAENADVDVTHQIKIAPKGKLFAEGTPIKYNLYELDVEANKVVKQLGYGETFTGVIETEALAADKGSVKTYALDLTWPEDGTNDTAFAGKTGEFDITVTVDQDMN